MVVVVVSLKESEDTRVGENPMTRASEIPGWE